MSAAKPLLASLIVLCLIAPEPAAATTDRSFVIDLSPFTPLGVGGEVFGVSTVEGEVVHARLDVTFVSDETEEWSMSSSFFGFPQGGSIGFSSEAEGWSGTGTFTTTVESDALNGSLTIPDGQPFWSWFMSWVGGSPFELPGGGIGVGPMDGHFEVLTLTLFLAPCPDGDVDRPWVDVGGALAGASGEPVLAGSGSLCEGESGSISLGNALPGSTTNLVIGLSELSAPFKGGLLVPQPDVILFGLPVDGGGSNVLAFLWPAGIPSGAFFWFQHWVADAAGPAGFSASNGLQASTP